MSLRSGHHHEEVAPHHSPVLDRLWQRDFPPLSLDYSLNPLPSLPCYMDLNYRGPRFQGPRPPRCVQLSVMKRDETLKWSEDE